MYTFGHHKYYPVRKEQRFVEVVGNENYGFLFLVLCPKLQKELLEHLASLGIYPAVDPLESTSRILSPDILGQEHYFVAKEIQRILQRYKELMDIIAIMGMDELSDEDKILV